MTDYREVVRDADFKTQYDFNPAPDQEFDQAVGSSPRMSMRPVERPLQMMWLAPLR